MSFLSTLNLNHCICPLTSLIFSFDLIRNLIPDYSFSHVLKVTGRVLRRVSLVRERKEMGGNYRGDVRKEREVCVKKGEVKDNAKWRQAEKDRLRKGGICSRDRDGGTDRREGGEKAGGGRLTAVEGRVLHFLKIQILSCIGLVSWPSR